MIAEFDLKTEIDFYKQMSKMLQEEVVHYDFTTDDILAFLRKAGLILVPKIRQMIVWHLNKARDHSIIRSVVRAPRGGGKTFSIAGGIEFPLFHFFDYDCVNLGGSKAQADKAYEIVQEFILDPTVARHIESSIQKRTKKRNGTWINVLATSSRSVRSPHPGGPKKGGLLFIDEECEIQDPKIVKSAKPVVDSANPSAIIRASTQHRVDDTFEEVWDKAREQGYTRFWWDIFDVCEHCTRKCWVSVKDDPKNGCYDALRKDTYGADDVISKKGYCRGRARHDGLIFKCSKEGNWTKRYMKEYDWKKRTEGWIQLLEIYQAYIENDSETFEVEYLGRKAQRKGKVYPGDKIDEALVEEFLLSQKTLRRLNKSIGVDWGFANECAIIYAFFYNKKIYIYRVEYFTHLGIDQTVDHIKDRVKQDGHDMVLADAEGAYENNKLCDHVHTISVPFNVWKDFGVKNIKNLLEKDRLRIIKYYNGDLNPGYEKFVNQLSGYRYDDHGNYVKRDDHGPDAALCGLLNWAPKRKDRKGKHSKIGTSEVSMVSV